MHFYGTTLVDGNLVISIKITNAYSLLPGSLLLRIHLYIYEQAYSLQYSITTRYSKVLPKTTTTKKTQGSINRGGTKMRTGAFTKLCSHEKNEEE